MQCVVEIGGGIRKGGEHEGFAIRTVLLVGCRIFDLFSNQLLKFGKFGIAVNGDVLCEQVRQSKLLPVLLQIL